MHEDTPCFTTWSVLMHTHACTCCTENISTYVDYHLILSSCHLPSLFYSRHRAIDFLRKLKSLPWLPVNTWWCICHMDTCIPLLKLSLDHINSYTILPSCLLQNGPPCLSPSSTLRWSYKMGTYRQTSSASQWININSSLGIAATRGTTKHQFPTARLSASRGFVRLQTMNIRTQTKIQKQGSPQHQIAPAIQRALLEPVMTAFYSNQGFPTTISPCWWLYTILPYQTWRISLLNIIIFFTYCRKCNM